MTVSINRPRWSALRERAGRAPTDSVGAPAEATAAPIKAAARSTAARSKAEPRTINAGWVLAFTVAFICLIAMIWGFSSGTAATGWLIVLIASALFGVPLALLVLRLMGVEDDD